MVVLIINEENTGLSMVFLKTILQLTYYSWTTENYLTQRRAMSAKRTAMAHFLSTPSIVNSYFTNLIKKNALYNKIYTVPLTR